MSEQETKTVKEARAMLERALSAGCGCAHCVTTSKVIYKLRELDNPNPHAEPEKMPEQPSLAPEQGS